MNQRWLFGRDSYRAPEERIDPSEYDVVSIAGDTIPKRFVLEHHYSGSYPSARYRFGLYRGDTLAGVAVFSHPCRNEVLTSVFPGEPTDSVELGRFVLLEEVKGNGETWFLARCFEQLRREGLRGVVSFSDPLPRVDITTRRVVFPGHIGTIYQAHNAVYAGRATARTIRVLPDGRVLSDRALSKIRQGDKGWRYAAALLERAGAPPCDGDRLAWLRQWLPAVTRPTRHPGNHRYAWKLSKRTAMTVVPAAYPKLVDRLTTADAYLLGRTA